MMVGIKGGDVCAARSKTGPCILVFKNEGGSWKLIGFEGRIEFGKGGKLKLSE